MSTEDQIPFRYQISTPAVSDVITNVDLKSDLRISGTDDDDLIDLYISIAIGEVERRTGLALNAVTYKAYLDRFPNKTEIELDIWPINAISSIGYNDTDGNAQTFASSNYYTSLVAYPGKIKLKPTSSWPNTDESPDNVVITFTAGYASESAVPAVIKYAVMRIVGHYYENRNVAAFPAAVSREIQMLLNGVSLPRFIV